MTAKTAATTTTFASDKMKTGIFDIRNYLLHIIILSAIRLPAS